LKESFVKGELNKHERINKANKHKHSFLFFLKVLDLLKLRHGHHPPTYAATKMNEEGIEHPSKTNKHE